MRYQVSINGKIRKKVNDELRNLGTYHNEIPFEKIQEVLKNNGLVALQEDDTEFEGWFCGENSNADIALGKLDTEYEKNDLKFYEQVENSLLRLTWYLMRPGRYEILTYIS